MTTRRRIYIIRCCGMQRHILIFCIIYAAGYYPVRDTVLHPPPPQVPTSHTKPKEQTTRRTQTQPSSTQRVATPTRTKRKSTTSNQNGTPHSSVLFGTPSCFWGPGQGGERGGCDGGIWFRITFSESRGVEEKQKRDGVLKKGLVLSRCLVQSADVDGMFCV